MPRRARRPRREASVLPPCCQPAPPFWRAGRGPPRHACLFASLALYPLHCTLCTVPFALYPLHCTLCTVSFALHPLHAALALHVLPLRLTQPCGACYS